MSLPPYCWDCRCMPLCLFSFCFAFSICLRLNRGPQNCMANSLLTASSSYLTRVCTSDELQGDGDPFTSLHQLCELQEDETHYIGGVADVIPGLQDHRT